MKEFIEYVKVMLMMIVVLFLICSAINWRHETCNHEFKIKKVGKYREKSCHKCLVIEVESLEEVSDEE